ncbi:hypothetical protein IAT38_004904 [Cryptococcus sp. DSM 104549]
MSTDTDDEKIQCESLQEDELTVLESIYPEQVTVLPNPSQKPGRLLSLHLPITLPNPTTTHLATTASGPSATTLTISHLPPLAFRLVLPPLYPLSDPPRSVSLKAPLPDESGGIVGNWLPKALLRRIEAKLGEMWVEEKEVMGEGTGVLWKWWEWVVNGDFLTDVNMMKAGTLELPTPPMITASTFFTILKTHNAVNMNSEFERTAFSCTICWENRKGSRCVQMPGCGCVFCTQCLNDCWTLAITEGTLESVACPSPACVKRRATRDSKEEADDDVDPELVESVVGKELRVRWEELKQRRIVETDPTYCICPRPTCQAAVPPPALPSSPTTPTSTIKVIRLSELSAAPSTPVSAQEAAPPPAATEDRWAAYRLCPKCNFSFCLYCSCTWHGPHTVCALPATSALVMEYLSYPEGSEGRARIEVQRGKTNMERMVARWQEDELNKKWLEASTSACPGCGVRVEKSHGCNHMTCGRCQAHFCYRCGESIRPTDPYRHFNTPGKPCYMKLFDFDAGSGLGQGQGGGVAFVGDDVGVEDLPLIQQGDEGFNWRDFREGGRFAEW